ncbi:TetR family transcriptional regulator [Frigoribacterium sp. CFBP9030]|uniref:TetR family transcriptional regulator n=1 Tax=Frigoribacterium sp. CFBP9030 TaxID=3096537 RepID=UPI002A6B8E14|nr:TetR family transcriptional regulator [Frigoribacterium sp. CFBP9030]MDY0892766.1 TetR family transcriptional regulator [Frigoribacterium sp. CFBP9030]
MAENKQLVGGLRAAARDAVRQQLADVAIDLISERGFDGVTVEQIASAAGVSVRSVHRYFPAKEDMVVGGLSAYGSVVRDALLERPQDEPILKSLEAAYGAMLRTRPQTDRDKIAVRLLADAPSLHARNAEKHLAWAALLEPIVADRLVGLDIDLRAQVLVGVSISTFSSALAVWAQPGETRGVHEVLTAAFETLRSA